MEIKDKVALVTGGASGIGKAVGLELALRGAKAVALVDLTEEACKPAGINKDLGKTVAHAFCGNVTDEDFRHRVYDAVGEQHGMVTICVPAAGITRDALAVKMNKETGKAEIYPLEKFRLVTEVDLIAPVYSSSVDGGARRRGSVPHGLKALATPGRHAGSHHLYRIDLLAGQQGPDRLRRIEGRSGGGGGDLDERSHLSRRPLQRDSPGFTDTPMVRALGEEYIQKYVLPETQLGRLIRPQEIADAICFMITNSAVSGELWADAGWHPSPA